MIDWVDITKETPEYYKEVLIYFSDADGSNEGISVASLQPNGFYDNKDNYWLESDNIKGEYYSEEDSIVKAWFDFHEHLIYPKING